MRFSVNGIVNRTSSTGSQRGNVCNVGDSLNGVHVVDLQEESILPTADTIERHGSDLLALTI
jgi:hypothetical protein